MSDIPLTGYRFAQIRHGDTLQSIALRELGDAARWSDLITINGLSYPYLTGDPAQASSAVLLYGHRLIVPAPTIQVSATSDPARVFGVDLALTAGALSATPTGDVQLLAGESNLHQALSNRIATRLQELIFHPRYGCGVHALKGEANGPTTGLLAAQYVKDAIRSDNRIDHVETVTADVQGDAVAVNASAVPVVGTSLDLSNLVV